MMNKETNTNDSLSDLENLIKPEIYSKQVIYSFSFLFTTCFGGILLMQNLKDIGKKKEANLVLAVSVLITSLLIILVTVSNISDRSVIFFCNLGGAVLLSEYFFKKYFPHEENYPKKKVWKPLIIGIILLITLGLLLFLAQDQLV